MEVYLDNSATTRPCEQAIEAMTASMRNGYYNPSALYGKAVEAEHALTEARKTIASSTQAGDADVVFTSGGTESDNLAILGYLRGIRDQGKVLYSAAEHPAVKNACREAAARYGHTAEEIPLDLRGSLDLATLEKQITSDTRLICVMQVCNETGIIMPLSRVVALRDRLAPNAAIHVDGVQGYLRVPFSMRDLGVQSYAVSAHKIHGPKGVGALVIRRGHRLYPQLYGGGQLNDLRSGTENTPGVLGFAAAVRAYPPVEKAAEQLSALKRYTADTLSEAIPDFRVLGPDPEEADSAPHILYATFPPVRAETMVHALEAEGVLVGTGSACSSHKRRRSETLMAMRIPPAAIDSAVRLSFSVQNTPEEIRYAVQKMIEQYRLLARFTRR